MTDEEFLYRFENAALSRQEWNHAAHLRMAFLYLKMAIRGRLLCRSVRERIRAFNAAHRNYTAYHETITGAFLRLVHYRLHRKTQTENPSFDAFYAQNLDLFAGNTVLLRHYEKTTLFSAEARADFVNPDREPLP
jgi:hypothetical protein